MSEGPIQTTAASKGRGLRIALAVSVALNLAVVGMVSGAMMRADGPHHPSSPRDLGFGIYSNALTPEDRADLRRRFIGSRPGMLTERRAMRQDLETVLAALRAEPFDPGALDAALQSQVERLRGRLLLGQSLMRDFLMDLTPEARRAFADRLEAAATRNGRPNPEETKD